MSRRQTLLLCAAACIAAGCTTVGPDYSRPDPGLAAGLSRRRRRAAGSRRAETFGALQWWSVFPDPDLQALIRTALEQNYDLRVAVQRIAQARAQVTVAGSLPYPTVGGALSAPYTGYSGSDLPPGSRGQQLRAADRARRGLGDRLLGQVQAQLRIGVGRPARRRGRALRGHGDAGLGRRPGLPDPARAGPDAGDLQAHGEFAHAVGRPGAGPARRRRGRHSRPAPGRDAVLRRDQDHPRVPASDRRDREPHQCAARAQPRADPARTAARPAGGRAEPCRPGCRWTC